MNPTCNINDMTNSEATKQPMLPDASICVAVHSSNTYQSPAIEQGLNTFANVNMLPGTEHTQDFLTRKVCACFVKT